jgi:hypothetical protein
VARASTTTDVFNAVGDAHRRAILDVLLAGERSVGAIVGQVSMPQRMTECSIDLRVGGSYHSTFVTGDARRRTWLIATTAGVVCLPTVYSSSSGTRLVPDGREVRMGNEAPKVS